MQTIYTFSYTPGIASGQNSTGTNWRMAYQQPIMLYKGIVNQFRVVVFNTSQRVVDLTGKTIQIQLVDKETKEYFFNITGVASTPLSGVSTVTINPADLANLNGRFYHITVSLESAGTDEILYIDDNYGAFTPVILDDGWNFTPAND